MSAAEHRNIAAADALMSVMGFRRAQEPVPAEYLEKLRERWTPNLPLQEIPAAHDALSLWVNLNLDGDAYQAGKSANQLWRDMMMQAKA